MRMVTRILPLAALALSLGANLLPAQQPGNSPFQWYIGGHGGVIDFGTPVQGRTTIPMAGAHLLVTARRTGLLLSVEHGFGSNEMSNITFQFIDTAGVLVDEQAVPVSYDYLRKYSAMLMAFPIKGPITPYFGIGVGILHTGDHDPDDSIVRELGSSGFASLVGGLNFRVSRFSAFGQYQVTTGPQQQFSEQVYSDGSRSRYFGNLYNGPSHTFSAGLRFGLGNARERPAGGGY